MYIIAFFLVVGAIITFFAIPGDLYVRVGQAPTRKPATTPASQHQ
jgi:hypothetical protein